MYSVVLLMALSGGAEAPDLGHHKCSGGGGCSGGYVVAGCTGGGGYGCTGGGGYGCTGGYVMAGCSGSASCSGKHHKLFGGGGGLFKKHHSCHGASACHGGGGCTGGYGGCTGGVIYSGCTGGMGYGGCTGGMVYPGCAGGMVTPMTPPAGEKLKTMPEEKKKEKKEGEVSAPATIVLLLPADARVAIDGVVTASTSSSRTFVTPELNPAKTFVYRLSAQIVRGGETLTVTEDVAVRAGEETRVSFGADRFTTVTVAAK